MANRALIDFGIVVNADGTNTSFTASLAGSPFGFNPPGATGILTSAVPSLTPTGVTNLSTDAGVGISGSVGLLGVITFTFASAPAAGRYNIYGTLIF